MGRKQGFVVFFFAVLAAGVTFGGQVKAQNTPPPGISGGPAVVAAPATPSATASTTTRAPRLPNSRLCAAEYSRLRSSMGSTLRCLDTAEWARLEQLCGPHGLSVDRQFSRYTREHCPSLDLNVLGRVSGATVQPECLGSSHPVVERGRTVDCTCNEGMTPVRLWSRRYGRPRVDCFGSQVRANFATQEWVRDEIAPLRNQIIALCRPADGQDLEAACRDLRDRINRIEETNSAPVTPETTSVVTPVVSRNAPDFGALTTRLDGLAGDITALTTRMRAVECRLNRVEGREIPENCPTLPALPPRPANATSPASSNHNFDLSAGAMAVWRPGGGPFSPLGRVSGAWRYQLSPGSDWSLYLRGDFGGGDMGWSIGGVYAVGGGLGLAYRASENSSVLFGVSALAYLQPGDSTLRPASGEYRGVNAGVEVAYRRHLGSRAFVDFGLQVHYGDAVRIDPPATPGGPNQDVHWNGLGVTPFVNLGVTF